MVTSIMSQRIELSVTFTYESTGYTDFYFIFSAARDWSWAAGKEASLSVFYSISCTWQQL